MLNKQQVRNLGVTIVMEEGLEENEIYCWEEIYMLSTKKLKVKAFII